VYPSPAVFTAPRLRETLLRRSAYTRRIRVVSAEAGASPSWRARGLIITPMQRYRSLRSAPWHSNASCHRCTSLRVPPLVQSPVPTKYITGRGGGRQKLKTAREFAI